MTPLLTQTEFEAVEAYARKHGRTWKSKLRAAWAGNAPHDDTGTLRTLRNSHGPSWLDAFSLKRSTAHRHTGA